MFTMNIGKNENLKKSKSSLILAAAVYRVHRYFLWPKIKFIGISESNITCI